MTQSRKYIASSLGQKFAEPVILNMEVLYNESRPLTPLVCFLSIGSDPTPYIEALAKKLEFKCKSISMGQGQEVHARKMITQALSEVGYFSVYLHYMITQPWFLGVLGITPELPFVFRLYE